MPTFSLVALGLVRAGAARLAFGWGPPFALRLRGAGEGINLQSPSMSGGPALVIAGAATSCAGTPIAVIAVLALLIRSKLGREPRELFDDGNSSPPWDWAVASRYRDHAPFHSSDEADLMSFPIEPGTVVSCQSHEGVRCIVFRESRLMSRGMQPLLQLQLCLDPLRSGGSDSVRQATWRGQAGRYTRDRSHPFLHHRAGESEREKERARERARERGAGFAYWRRGTCWLAAGGAGALALPGRKGARERGERREEGEVPPTYRGTRSSTVQLLYIVPLRTRSSSTPVSRMPLTLICEIL